MLPDLLIDILFPPLCFSCDEPLTKRGFLCESCLPYLVLLEPSQHCPRCFAPRGFHTCEKGCLSHQAFCFAASPLMALFHHPRFAKAAISYVLIQLHRLAWPIDLVSFVPLHPFQKQPPLTDKFLAKKVAQAFGLPCQRLLYKIGHEEFAVTPHFIPAGRSILLLGFCKSSLVDQAITVLKESGPCYIYGLYLTRGVL